MRGERVSEAQVPSLGNVIHLESVGYEMPPRRPSENVQMASEYRAWSLETDNSIEGWLSSHQFSSTGLNPLHAAKTNASRRAQRPSCDKKAHTSFYSQAWFVCLLQRGLHQHQHTSSLHGWAELGLAFGPVSPAKCAHGLLRVRHVSPSAVGRVGTHQRERRPVTATWPTLASSFCSGQSKAGARC